MYSSCFLQSFDNELRCKRSSFDSNRNQHRRLIEARPKAERRLKSLTILQGLGPSLGRPQVDTIKGSKIKNLKELRIQNKNRVFRIFFAFDPERNIILLIGGDKKGDNRFYETMLRKCERLYELHLSQLRGMKNEKSNKKKEV